MRNLSFLFFLFIFCSFTIQPQVTINIPGDYPTIQQGVDAASNGDLVLVADGTYIENINFKGKAITVASHFIQDGNRAHIDSTIIDGSDPSHPDTGSVVFFVSGEDTNSVLCGFTITGGSGTINSSLNNRIGAGVLAFFSGAKICHNIITLNTIDNSNTYNLCLGGGIFAVQSPNLIISNNIISDNLIENYRAVGGGISIYQTGPTWVISNEIINNVIDCTIGSGGGIDIWIPNNNLYVQNNIIRGNQVLTNNFGGGGIDIYNSSTAVFISNNLIAENQAFQGGGILVEYDLERNFSKENNFKLNNHNWGKKNILDNIIPSENITLLEAVIENNTVVDNIATSYCGGIICLNALPEIRNCIVWGNNGPGAQIHSTGLVEYSDIEGGYTGTGNINEDPNFDDTTYFVLNYHSSCIDAGNPDPMYNDIEDPQNLGYALLPARGTVRNDMGHMGGPNSLWAGWDPPVSVKRDETKNGVPSEFALSQNYPNPFNPNTTIKYGLPERSFVELKVYDILGREVTTMVNEELDTGFYEIDFNASQLASGIYLYQLKAGSFIETKKMILLK